jgi:EmrB/QacA subfamily drug resistance transporter
VTRLNVVWTLVITSLALFMVVLDNLVVSTALPVIRVELGASIEELEWTVNAYTLTFAVFLLTGAALGDRFGRRRMFAAGLAVFTAASAAAALAPSMDALIAARAVQGVGGALVMPLTLTIISGAFPAGRRGAALGLWGAVGGMAVAGGPLVGGVVIEGLAWQWIFWLNVPIGLVLAPLALLRLRESHGPDRSLDLPGLAFVSGGLLGLVWGIVNGHGQGWTSVPVAASLATGAVLLLAFVGWERHATRPMLPLRFFRDRRRADRRRSLRPDRRPAAARGRARSPGARARLERGRHDAGDRLRLARRPLRLGRHRDGALLRPARQHRPQLGPPRGGREGLGGQQRRP